MLQTYKSNWYAWIKITNGSKIDEEHKRERNETAWHNKRTKLNVDSWELWIMIFIKSV